MITKMIKYGFVVHHSDYDSFLEKIRNMGVLHISQLKENSEAYDALHAKYAQQLRVDRLITYCQQHIDSHSNKKNSNLKSKFTVSSARQISIDDKWKLIEELENLIAKKDSQQQSLIADEKELSRMSVWGTFTTEDIAKLETNGYYVNFFTCNNREYKTEWETDYNAFVINVIGTTVYFITVTEDSEPNIEAERFVLNELSTDELQSIVDEKEKALTESEQELTQFIYNNYRTIQTLSAEIFDQINLGKVYANTCEVADKTIMLLEGFCPQENCNELNSLLNTLNVYYQTSDPSDSDIVPIKLRNNKFTKLFEPLTGMYGMPVYQEFDPTPILAPFFLLFFALCMGDAGYGLVLILFGLGLKTGKIKMEMFDGLGPIISTLGIGTTIVGLFLGTAFGIDLYSAEWVPQELKNIMIKGTVNGFDVQMIMALGIGIFHICFAMVVKAICYTKRWGFKNNLSVWGWLLLIVGGITTALLTIAGLISFEAAKYAVIVIGIISALGIYFFNDTKRNILLNVGSGLWDTYNMATGLLGDTLSYIRLYALGLAGGLLGGAFNDLGDMILGDGNTILLYIPYIIVLVFGHVLNLAMSALGAFVHPLRLTFVEYFKNSGYEGKGEKYNPLAKTAE